MNEYFIEKVIMERVFFERYKRTKGYLESLTHNVIVGDIDGFAEVLQMEIDRLGKEDKVSDEDKLQVVGTTAPEKQLSVTAVNNKKFYVVAMVCYCKITERFDVKQEREYEVSLKNKQRTNN